LGKLRRVFAQLLCRQQWHVGSKTPFQKTMQFLIALLTTRLAQVDLSVAVKLVSVRSAKQVQWRSKAVGKV